MVNSLYEFRATEAGDRGYVVMHSYIHLVDGNQWVGLALGQGLHWWGIGYDLSVETPECLRNYKRRGE